MNKNVNIPGAIKVAKEFQKFLNGDKPGEVIPKFTIKTMYRGYRDDLIAWLSDQDEDLYGTIEVRQ